MTRPPRLYLDWNAAAPLRPEAKGAMLSAMEAAGNPSSIHAEGRAARAILEKAREQVAALAGCKPAEVVFVSGATEAAALALGEAQGGVWGRADLHPSAEVWRDPALTEAQARAEGRILAYPAAEGETGAIRLPEAEAAARSGAKVFLDAAQAAGKIRWRFDAAPLWAASLSASKIGGPKGCGALILREGAEIRPLLRGGGQESNRRAGTENLVGIAGFGAAAEAALRDLEAGVWEAVRRRRDRWEAALKAVAPEALVFAADGPFPTCERLPNVCAFALAGWTAETQLMQLDLAGVAVSSGSACSSGKVAPSHVLKAMGVPEDLARCAIRVSLGPTTADDEIDRFIAIWTGLLKRRPKPQAAA